MNEVDIDIECIRTHVFEVKEFYPQANLEPYSDKYDGLAELTCLYNWITYPHLVTCLTCPLCFNAEDCSRMSLTGLR